MQNKPLIKSPSNPVIPKPKKDAEEGHTSVSSMPLEQLKAELDDTLKQLNAGFERLQGLKAVKAMLREELAKRYKAKNTYINGSEWSKTVKAVSHSYRNGRQFAPPLAKKG